MARLFHDPEACRYHGIFNDSFPPIMDGVTLTVQNYVRRLLSTGRPTCVVTPWNPVVVEADYPVIKYFSLPIHSRKPYRYGYPKLDPFIWHRLRKTPFRIVHSHCPFSSGRLAVYVKKKQHVPLVGTFHSKYKTDLEHSFKRTPWMVPMIMKRILAFFNACDEVWIPQAQVEETVREYGYTGPLTVVENGSDMATPVNLGQVRREARRRLGIRDGEIALLFVGQHIWEKGIGVIVEALSLLGPHVPFRMNFVGNGYAAGELRDMVRRLGLEERVSIHGIVADRSLLSDFYAASDLFLFPSFYDNAPLVVREAAAYHIPSVLLKGSTASEVITDGKNGFLADRTPRSYAEIITTLHTDPNRMKRAGAEAARTLIRSWESVMDEVTDRYDFLIRTHK